MQYEVEVGGRRRQVVVTRTGGTFAVAFDGHTRSVDVARIDAHALSLVVDSVWPENSSVKRRSYEVSVVPDPAGGQLVVHVGAVPVAVGLDGRRRSDRKDDGRVAGSGPQRLLAPMPGRVVRVLVNTGDSVRPRQPVVVVEAMKMENELRTTRGGTVAEIHAREGMSVDAGALLIVIQ
jgi:glutaconyl-CoA/methylmalonyl-CoA decarboxylase subunit gamma